MAENWLEAIGKSSLYGLVWWFAISDSRWLYDSLARLLGRVVLKWLFGFDFRRFCVVLIDRLCVCVLGITVCGGAWLFECSKGSSILNQVKSKKILD